MTITQEQATWFAETFQRLTDNVGRAVLGKAGVIRLKHIGPLTPEVVRDKIRPLVAELNK